MPTTSIFLRLSKLALVFDIAVFFTSAVRSAHIGGDVVRFYLLIRAGHVCRKDVDKKTATSHDGTAIATGRLKYVTLGSPI